MTLATRELPAPASDQAYCNVSALECGFIQIPLVWVIDTAQEGDTSVLPVLAFLIRHSTNGDVLLFDLGVRKDLEALPTAYHGRINDMGFRTSVPEDAADALAKGGLAPADIATVCYSHLHYDHIGDSRPYTNATFVVGGAARPLVEHGWPEDPKSLFPQDLLPAGRTRFLDDPEAWPPLGPFPHALDFYGDGSLYIVDAPRAHAGAHQHPRADVGRRGLDLPGRGQCARSPAAHGRGGDPEPLAAGVRAWRQGGGGGAYRAYAGVGGGVSPRQGVPRA